MEPLKILNVDDRKVNRYIRTETLQGAGYQVVEAATGKEALERAECECPQLILLDMNLPDIPGEEVCRRIKARHRLGSIIVLQISASRTSVQDRVIGLESGADGYLVEPVEPELLLATVQSMLRLWRAETRLEESLAQTRELAARYQSLIEAVPHLIYTATADGRVDYVSEQFPAYTNFPAKETFGAGWLEFVHPADREGTLRLWSHAVGTGEPFETEYRLRHRDGTYRWNRARARAVRNAAGQIVQWVASVTDVHERKLLDDEIRLRHEEFVALAEHSPDIIARLDPELRYTYVNRAMAGISPWQPEQYIGRTNRELGWPDEVQERWETECRAVLATGQARQFEFRDETAKGRAPYCHARIVPEFGRPGLSPGEPRVKSLLSITTDITERREAELAVVESERRLRRLVEGNVIGVVIGNRERITFANDVFLRLVGYTQEDVRAGRLHWRDMTPPEYLALDEKGIAELQERGACTPFEKEFWRKDGVRVPILIGAAALDGPVTEWACFVLDLSQLKNAEDALRKTNLALRRSNTDLAQFAYAASHDLQEPLRTVAIYTELLARQQREQFSPEAGKQMEFILDAVTRMQNLIRNLLTFSQAQSAEFSPSPIPAGDMIEGAMANLKNAVDESGAAVTWRDLPAIRADAAHFTLVFQNLISNAIKYRKPEEAPRIGIRAERDNESWIFSVRDNGIGFEQEYAERIFTPFTRLHGREFPGTGIGLAIVKRIIERHEGQVWAAGEPGVGATFSFRLPIR
ncbi:MAG: PAS domain S-box protein [Acidobacteriota bacterium]